MLVKLLELIPLNVEGNSEEEAIPHFDPPFVNQLLIILHLLALKSVFLVQIRCFLQLKRLLKTSIAMPTPSLLDQLVHFLFQLHNVNLSSIV